MRENYDLSEARLEPVPTDERVYNDQPVCEETIRVKPNKQNQLREYEIRISFLNRGCIVNIGCKSIAFETNEKAMKEITRYVNDPINVYDEWVKVFNEE
jgi:hypothetical protein